MPASSNFTLSTATCEPLSLPGLPWPVELHAHPRARHLRLRIDEARGLLRLTVPRRVSRRAALDWVGGQSEWVADQLAKLEPAERFEPGAEIPFDGDTIRIEWREDAPRSPRLSDRTLVCGGPPERFPARIDRWLRSEARRRLQEETSRLAEDAGIADGPVSVGDAGTRWGSCSATGAIRYNWRLILAPAAVRGFVVAHEVAHRVHHNHGAAFHALERKLYGGDVAAARLELRRIGARLQRVGRG
ncbi:MAG TPA: SprT family zinc-dependent metalloprotease [Sphingomicrobium sp.]|nr:SprT family zinc-dependent metalloprotease [Sphingomicrobium sp.]